ncbi:MAG: DUF642 domain-containing protein, partial [Luteolibacter sp.]
MKSFKSLLRACSMLLLASFSASLTHAQATVRILPLGDSLTAGYSNGAGYPGAYRNKLYTLLTNAGYPLDYVGTNTEPNNPTIPDTNNQGMGGFRIDQIQSGLDGWLSSVADPDVILLLIGTNDFLQGYNISTAPARLESLIADIATKRPFAKIIVSNLPVRSDPTQDSQEITFNAAIPGIVSNQVSLGRQVSMINIRPTLTTADLFDGIHPTQTGYEKIADVWFPAITNVIAPTGTANLPAIARVIPQPSLTQLTVTFSKPVADSAATLANFSINNGLSISQAVLDSSKRTVTLTTSAQSAGVVYTLSVNGVRDRTPSQNLIAAGANALFATNAQANGSFESDFAGWTSTGNMLIKSAAPYAATNGSKLVAFATAQSTPNGVLSQSFATTPGQTYQLAFDAGVFGEIVQQRLQVSVTGTSSVLSQTLTLTGPGGNNTNWLPQSFAFTANSAATTLTFTDVSTTSINADLVLDNVRLTPQLVSTITLTSSPSSGASIGLSPADVNGNSTGTTGFPRSYVNGTTVILTAPATFGGSSFLKWQKNGSDISSNATTSVLVDGSYTFNAVYGTSVVSTSLLTNGSFESGLTGWTPTGNLRATVAGASTQGTSLLEFNGGNTTPNGVISQSFPTTIGSTYTLAFDAGVYSFNTSPQRLQVNVTGSGSLFSQLLTLTGFGNGTTKWFPQSFTFVANSATTTLSFTDTSATTSALDLYLDNVRVTGPPVTQRTLTVASAPTTGVSFTVSPNDVNGASNGITQFTRTYNDGAVVNLTAPATSGANNFSKWQKDGIDYSATAATSVTMSSSFTMTAVYTAPVIAPGTLVNGSFESNETGWTMTGNRLAYSSDGSYVATNGQKLLVLSGGTATPDAVVSQSFNTTPGQSYQLSFDVGSLAVNTAEQRLKVDVAGTASLVSQTESVFGNGAGNSSWTAKTYNFTADSATTTLTFSDLSPVTAGIDLLLDNVVVALAGPAPVTRTLTVASSPATGVSITLSPNDLSANGNGTTQFTRTYNDGTVVSLTAPATSGSSTFSKWQKDGADFSVTAATSVTLSANTTLTAVYTTPAVLPGSLVNGSFESGETGWTMTGNRLAYASDGSYVATDGTKLLVLSGGTATPNAVISQSITTTVGQTYQLSFDVGSLAVNTAEQRLKVDVAGTVSRLSQTESVFGNNSGTSVWVSKTYTFTADSTSTTLTFSDISPTSAGIDLLLDNVKIQLPGGPTTRTLTVASSPATGVGIIVSPNDLSATGNGTTQFTRTYNDGAVVSLT